MAKLESYDPSAVADGLAEMEFRQLAQFDAGHAGVFWSEAGGPSSWEMHPGCDEMLQVLEGEIEVEVLPEGGEAGVKTRVSAGSFFVVPRGCLASAESARAHQGVIPHTGPNSGLNPSPKTRLFLLSSSKAG